MLFYDTNCPSTRGVAAVEVEDLMRCCELGNGHIIYEKGCDLALESAHRVCMGSD